MEKRGEQGVQGELENRRSMEERKKRGEQDNMENREN